MGTVRIDSSITHHVEVWRTAKHAYWLWHLHAYCNSTRRKRHALNGQIFEASLQRDRKFQLQQMTPEILQRMTEDMNQEMRYLNAMQMQVDGELYWALNAAYHLHGVFNTSQDMAALDRYITRSGIRSRLGLSVRLGEPRLQDFWID